MKRVSVFGAGAWGTTLAQVLSDAGNDVLLWARSAEVVAEINNQHSNEKYLQGITLPNSLTATSDIKAAFDHSEIYVLAIPTQQLRSMLEEWKPFINQNAIVVSTLKGIELNTDLRVSEVVSEIWGDIKFALITGPNLADELSMRQLAGAVVASNNLATAVDIQKVFTTDYYRVYTSTDVMGCELAGAIKSVIALSVGMAIGMGFGENTQSMLITRGLNEISRMCAAHGSDPLTAASLAGMGDLVASCGSPLSRNRTFGEVLGETQSMESARTRVAKTVEGVSTSRAALELAHRVGVEVPIIEAVADVVAGIITPRDAFKRIMEISTRAEGFAE
ncbi:MAG: NAD(P)H-dependent glycerol-3-phosphate dehydrogenase [Candidatus Nanopelagicaceae bacterium]|jgi:glycerol-3-phosphate dehydrogenase (NAD(P)+)